MTDKFFEEIKALEEWPPKEQVKEDKREKFPCQPCAGTGRWSGGYNQHGESKCFACNGKGFFLTSEHDRRKARQQRAESKSKKLAAAQAALVEEHPTLIGDLRGMTEWNSFAASLVEQFNTRGFLSENQVNAAYKMIAKTAATKKAKAKAREDAAVEVDLSTIRAMFNRAVEKGHKRPTYRALGLIIFRAPDHGRNAGALYIKTDGDEYQGKITAEDKFYAVSSADSTTSESLKVIAADPADAAVKYGRLTGDCSCCGRTLTNKLSIERGIGPICADRMGL